MRRLICNEFLSLNAFGFVFYNRHDLLRLQRLVLFAFDLVLLAFDRVLLVFLAFDRVLLAPPLGLDSNDSNILLIAADLCNPTVHTKCSGTNEGSNTRSNPTNTNKYGFGFITLPVASV